MATIKRAQRRVFAAETLTPSAAVLATILTASPAAQAAERAGTTERAGAVEEVVVTGSYIRRDNFDISSPLDVVTNEDIAEIGAPNVGETLAYQTFNFGVSRIQNFLGGNQLTSSADTDANLRGLGAGATLELMNGKLQLAGNANFMYPQIAVERLETLLDGASALYGSQAVAGVVNYVPYTKFDGLRAMVDVRSREEGGGEELVAGLLTGMSGERGDFVFAFESRHRKPLYSYDIPEYLDYAGSVGQGYSGVGNPGSFRVPTRTATGALGASAVRADPGCGNQAGSPGSLHSTAGNHPNGIVGPGGASCLFSFHEFWDYKTKLDNQLGYLHLNHNFTDSFRLKGELVYNRSTDIGRGSPINSGASGAGIVHNIIGGAILGEHPGNPYRAFVDANTNGRIDSGEALFARDVCTATACGGVGDGIPDRDLNGDGVPDPGAQGNPRYPVVLAANPRDPNSGIQFNEDVQFSAWRPLGKQPRGIPGSNNPDYSAPIENKWTFSRYLVGAEADLGESWTLNVDYHFNHVIGVTTGVDASPTAIALGLMGRLGPQQNLWFNPFNTSQYQCANRVCGSSVTPSNSLAYNNEFVLDQVVYQFRTTTNTYMHTADVVAATGELFSLPAGDVGFAVGGQYLNFKEDTYDSEHSTGCDGWARGCVYDFKGQRHTQAAFFQAEVPVFKSDTFGSLDFDVAGRYTEVEGKDGSFDPKLGLVYQPFDMLSLRSSWGTSFIAPSLRQEQSATVANIETRDLTCTYSGNDCNPLVQQFVLQIQPPNPNLENETADTFNVGFTVRLLDGDLTFQADWVNINYENRISQTRPIDVLTADFARFEAYIQQQCGTLAQSAGACHRQARNTWVSHATTTLENPAVQRAGTQLSAVAGGWFNAAGVETTQIDGQVRYAFDIGAFGRMNVGASATYVDQFDVRATATAVPVSKVGKVNVNEIYPALPRLRLFPRINWTLSDHSVTLLGYHHSGAYVSGTGASRVDIPSYERFTLLYNYSMQGLFGSDGSSTLTIGSENVTDTKAFKYSTAGGYNSQLEDPVGRTWFARFTHNF